MKATIMPGKAKGTVMAPPSKSMAHRMLIGAGLSMGTSVIENIDLSEDIKATLGILEALGSEYTIEGRTVMMKGIGGKKVEGNRLLDTKESGSTLRFFIPILLTGGGKSKLTGAKSLFARPLGIYEDICNEQGIFFHKTEDSLELDGQLKATHYKIPGNISSQFITGLLYALPLLNEDSVLEVIPPVESKAYIEMTLEALEIYGIKVERKDNTYYIPGNQTYQAVNNMVEGDYSNAAFLDAFDLIGGNVQVEGLKEDSLQGDKVYREYYQILQQSVLHHCGTNAENISSCKRELPQMDISECPDLGPILIGMAAAKQGAIFTGTKRLKIKESDRGTVMAEELKKFGIKVDVQENQIIVYPGKLQKPNEILDSHNDHRIAMTLATLCTLTGGTIEGCMAVNKSYPGYYDAIQSLGIQVKIEDEKIED